MKIILLIFGQLKTLNLATITAVFYLILKRRMTVMVI